MSEQAEGERIKQGETVKCDECDRARPIELPPVELFGAVVGYGPGGENDQFVERDGEVLCQRCWKDELSEDGDG